MIHRYAAISVFAVACSCPAGRTCAQHVEEGLKTGGVRSRHDQIDANSVFRRNRAVQIDVFANELGSDYRRSESENVWVDRPENGDAPMLGAPSEVYRICLLPWRFEDEPQDHRGDPERDRADPHPNQCFPAGFA